MLDQDELHIPKVFFCCGVSTTVKSFSSRKNWDREIPKAPQTRSKEVMEGIISLRYHVEIVDWVRPDFSASWYSDHPRSFLNCTILSKIFIKTPPYDYYLVKKSLENNAIHRIILTILCFYEY